MVTVTGTGLLDWGRDHQLSIGHTEYEVTLQHEQMISNRQLDIQVRSSENIWTAVKFGSHQRTNSNLSREHRWDQSRERVWSKKRRSLGLRLEEPQSSVVRKKKIKIAETKKKWPPQKKI